METTISYFKNAFELTPSGSMPLDMFLEDIRCGKWEDIVLPLRALKGNDRDEAKKKVPCVTLAGTFSTRRDDGLIEHSGFIAIDIDDVEDPEKLKDTLSKDPYVAAAFVSIGGHGLCVIFRITPSRHHDAFRGLGEYLYNRYKVIIDPTSINPSRLRFVSFDPHIYIAPHPVEKFTHYPKIKEPKKIERVVFVQADFDEIMHQILYGRINLCENYYEWLRIGFAFADHFGENGRDLFHTVSSMSGKYDPAVCDRQYTNCLKHQPTDRKSTIATFYYYCKLAGITTYSERTKKIVSVASASKRAGLSAEQVVENLRKFEEIEGDEVLDIVNQVRDQDIKIEEVSLIEEVEMFLRQNYKLRRNGITLYIENDGQPMETPDFNTIYIAAKKVFDNLTYDLIDRLINSQFTPTFNPIHEWFDLHKDEKSTGHIEKLFSSIKTKDPAYLLHFGRKWLVGAISAVYKEHSPLMLVLSGERQGTGKTEFFRRLLPKELSQYYAESKLDAGKDDLILMCKKWFVMDDEMGGKSKKESKLLKELTSKQVFTLREPYGRKNVDMRRIAVLCGTTNDDQILNDPTGNRRIIPIPVLDIDHDVYNSVNKTLLFMEAWHLFHAGFDWKLNRNDIDWLKLESPSFRETCIEAELFSMFFKPYSGQGPCEELTASEIKTIIEMDTRQKLNVYRLGAEMKNAGVEQLHRREGRTTKRVYLVERTNRVIGMGPPLNMWTPPHIDESPEDPLGTLF